MCSSIIKRTSGDVLKEVGLPSVDLAELGARCFPGENGERQMRDMRSRVLLAAGMLRNNFRGVAAVLLGVDELLKHGFDPDVLLGSGCSDKQAPAPRLVADIHVLRNCGTAVCKHGAGTIARWSERHRTEGEISSVDLNQHLTHLYAALSVVRVAEQVHHRVEEIRTSWGYPDSPIRAWYRSTRALGVAKPEDRDLISIARDYTEPHFAWLAQVPAASRVLQTFFKTIDPGLVEASPTLRR